MDTVTTDRFAEPGASPALLLLGTRRDPLSERGVECPGGLPLASDPDLVERARAAKEALGERVFILGHHYQREEIIQFSDFRGDSYKLSQQAATQTRAEYILFCGVHFMAESADILSAPHQQVILPNLEAGCSMADMAKPEDVETCWTALQELGIEGIVPITYMNSAASLKAFCGRNGGIVCTSSNASSVYDWAFQRGEKILFFPDAHLGRNTGARRLRLANLKIGDASGAVLAERKGLVGYVLPGAEVSWPAGAFQPAAGVRLIADTDTGPIDAPLKSD